MPFVLPPSRRPGALLAGLAFVPLLAGCGLITIQRGEPEAVSAAPIAPAAPKKLDFAAEERALEAARRAFDEEAWDEARRHATSALRMLEARSDMPETPPSKARLIRAGAVALAGLSHARQGDTVAALLTLDAQGLDRDRCFREDRERCAEMHDLAYEQNRWLFRRMVSSYRSVRWERTHRVSSAFLSENLRFAKASVDGFVQEYLTELRKDRAPYGAVWIRNELASRHDERVVGDRVQHRWRGQARGGTSTSCTGAGRVRVGAQSLQVQRCRRGRYSDPGAVVTMQLPKDEAERVDFDGGEAALVVFETRRVRGGGRTLDLGPVRLARVKR